MGRIEFRAPGEAIALAELLERALGVFDAEVCRSLIGRGALRVGGDGGAHSLHRHVPPGEIVSAEAAELEAPAESQVELSEARVIVPAPAWWRGALESGAGKKQRTLRFEVTGRRAGLAELTLACEGLPAPSILAMLARAGWPVLGDARRGGLMVRGGLRLRAAELPWQAEAAGADWWPDEPAFIAAESDGEPPRWRVSPATARIVRRGHPWILLDDRTDDPAPYAPGTLVEACPPTGPSLGLALIEGSGRPTARMWAKGSGAERKVESIEARVARALARRRKLMLAVGEARSEQAFVRTDALRLIHGEADGLPGLAVDQLGGVLRALVLGRASDHFRERALDALVHGLGDVLGAAPPIVEVLHLRDRPPGRLECVRLARGEARSLNADEAGRIVVHERGLAFLVDPGLSDPERSRPGVGLFLDQRENRERLARHARRGGHWLNLFAHTGAFSVALLAAGAERVTSVDLSAAYLRWLDENIALNSDRGVDGRAHESVRRDGRRYLSELAPGQRFAGIVLDPPTAAAAGRKFWSVGRDLEPLVGDALRHLEPGGVLLMCRNERAARSGLPELIRRAADAVGVAIEKVRGAPPGDDFPGLRGFPEGDSFSGVMVQRARSKRA